MPEPDWLKRARRKGLVVHESGSQPLPSDDLEIPEPRLLSERQWQAIVVGYARGRGWKVAHFRKVRVRRGNREYWETPVAADGKGFPDLIMVRDDVLLALELKVKNKIATEEQAAWLIAFAPVAKSARVWKPKDWLELRELLK